MSWDTIFVEIERRDGGEFSTGNVAHILSRLQDTVGDDFKIKAIHNWEGAKSYLDGVAEILGQEVHVELEDGVMARISTNIKFETLEALRAMVKKAREMHE